MHSKNIVRLLVLLVLAVTAALVSVSAASAKNYEPDYRYDTNLRWWVHNSLEQASYTDTHGKTVPKIVEVRCYTNGTSFFLAGLRRGIPLSRIDGVIAFYQGGNTVLMRNGTCQAATRFTEGVYTAETVGAFKTLLHEALHRQGFRSERNTETYAIASMSAAAQLVQYNRYLARGATDADAAWESATVEADRAQLLAWNQSNRWIASSYLGTWDEVLDAEQLGWAARLNR